METADAENKARKGEEGDTSAEAWKVSQGETLGGGLELVKEWAMQTPGDTHPRVNAMCLAFFPGGSLVENPLANAGSPRGVGLIPGSNPLEEEMATHSSILAWEILWTEKPGGLQSMGSQSRI